MTIQYKTCIPSGHTEAKDKFKSVTFFLVCAKYAPRVLHSFHT